MIKLADLYERDNHQCYYCRRIIDLSEATRDHIVPKARGGKKRQENLVLACRACNHEKAHTPVSDYLKRKNPTFLSEETKARLRGS